MNYGANPVKTKEMYQRDLNMSRMNLLLSAIFTLINLVMVVGFSVSTSFFFSASIPHYMTLMFAIYCGRFDAFYYEEYEKTTGKPFEVFANPDTFWVVFGFSVAILIGLFVLWFFSKKHKACSMIILSYYIVDTLFLVAFAFMGGVGVELLLQLLFHAWILYYAFLAVRAWKGMETAPSEKEAAAQGAYRSQYGNNPYVGSPYGRTYGSYIDDDEEEEYEGEEEIDEENEEDDTDEEDDGVDNSLHEDINVPPDENEE